MNSCLLETVKELEQRATVTTTFVMESLMTSCITAADCCTILFAAITPLQETDVSGYDLQPCGKMEGLVHNQTIVYFTPLFVVLAQIQGFHYDCEQAGKSWVEG